MIRGRVLFVIFAIFSITSVNGQGWVDQLQNQQRNVCCFDGDGRRLVAPDWDNLGKVQEDYKGTSGYRVLEDGIWHDVPNWAMVLQKNQDGIARVWWDRHYDAGHTTKTIRCFLKGVEG